MTEPPLGQWLEAPQHREESRPTDAPREDTRDAAKVSMERLTHGRA